MTTAPATPALTGPSRAATPSVESRVAPGTRAAFALAWREIIRFFRQRNRVIGAVATPLVFWLMLGLGLNETVRIPAPPPEVSAATSVSGDASGGVSEGASGGVSGDTSGGMGYLRYFFPGMVVLMILFTAIFSTISVIEDRREGFLQGVLASPAPRWAIVLGKVLGGATIATLQGLVLLAIWAVAFDWPGIVNLLAAVGILFLLAVGLTALGLLIAWPMDSTAGFHAVMNLLLMPMWFLCGAVFPVESAGPLKWIMLANPLTYGHAAFAAALQGGAAIPGTIPGAIPGAIPGVSLVFAALTPTVALVIFAVATAAAVWGATRLANRVPRA